MLFHHGTWLDDRYQQHKMRSLNCDAVWMLREMIPYCVLSLVGSLYPNHDKLHHMPKYVCLTLCFGVINFNLPLIKITLFKQMKAILIPRTFMNMQYLLIIPQILIIFPKASILNLSSDHGYLYRRLWFKYTPSFILTASIIPP